MTLPAARRLRLRSAPLPVLLVFLLAFAVAPSTAAGEDWIRLDEIEPGMRGTIRTVLQGRKLVEIEVELLGVLDDGIGPGTPMILGRFVDELGTWTGVAAGMSGSPVYVDGRLLGALSYAIGAFSKEPICGITPIREMKALERLPAGGPPGASRLAPAPLALVGQGFPPETLSMLEDLLAERGVAATIDSIPLAAGELAGEGAAPPSMEPGEPVAALLVWGDIVLGATGTITWREGDSLLAFGHPFLGFGRTALQMAPAEILWTVPSAFNSFKIARIGKPVGVV